MPEKGFATERVFQTRHRLQASMRRHQHQDESAAPQHPPARGNAAERYCTRCASTASRPRVGALVCSHSGVKGRPSRRASATIYRATAKGCRPQLKGDNSWIRGGQTEAGAAHAPDGLSLPRTTGGEGGALLNETWPRGRRLSRLTPGARPLSRG